ncbi:hypothetical protein AeNC1_012332 [Aphanomyces euteiches]|nr:hypothetical protein AeNC1_012332 [Aphanomyces euteiches]
MQRRALENTAATQAATNLQQQMYQMDAERLRERQILHEQMRQAQMHSERYQARMMDDVKNYRDAMDQAMRSKLLEMERELETLRTQRDELLQQTNTFNHVDQTQHPEPSIKSESMGVPRAENATYDHLGVMDHPMDRTNTLLSGFSAPKPPKFNGSSLDNRRAFALEYMEYVRAVMDVSGSTGMQIQLRPISTCIDGSVKEFVAEYHIQKPVDMISNDEWLEFFQAGLEHRNDQYSELETKIKRSIIMSEREIDADRRMDQWLHDYWKLLQKMNMPEYDQNHPKDAIKALVEGMRPVGLREYVRQTLAYDKKYLRNSVLQFFNFVREELRNQMKYIRSTATSANASNSTSGQKSQSSGNGTDDKKDSRVAKKLRDKKTGSSNSQGKEQSGERTPTCWGCKGPHRISDCPSTSESDKKEIAKRKRAEWSNNLKAKSSQEIKASKLPIPRHGRCFAAIPEAEGLGKITTLIDSGSDSAAIISFGLVDYLQQYTDIELNMVWLATPVILDSFGSDVKMRRHIVLC